MRKGGKQEEGEGGKNEREQQWSERVRKAKCKRERKTIASRALPSLPFCLLSSLIPPPAPPRRLCAALLLFFLCFNSRGALSTLVILPLMAATCQPLISASSSSSSSRGQRQRHQQRLQLDSDSDSSYVSCLCPAPPLPLPLPLLALQSFIHSWPGHLHSTGAAARADAAG